MSKSLQANDIKPFYIKAHDSDRKLQPLEVQQSKFFIEAKDEYI